MKKFIASGSEVRLGEYGDVLEDISGVDMILTSPPYNIGSKSPAITGRRKHGGYDPKSWGAIEDYPDSMPEMDYQKWQQQFLRWCVRRLNTNGVILYNHKPRHKNNRLIKPERWILPLEDEGTVVIHDEVVWDRGSTHNHCKSYVYPQSERIFVLCRPGAKPYFKNEDFYWKVRNGGVGDVWRIPPDTSSPHNAPFPIKIVRQCIRLWSNPGDLVMDPFGGSGTTMLGCIMEGRKFVGSERMEKYFDLSVKRIGEYVKCNRAA